MIRREPSWRTPRRRNSSILGWTLSFSFDRSRSGGRRSSRFSFSRATLWRWGREANQRKRIAREAAEPLLYLFWSATGRALQARRGADIGTPLLRRRGWRSRLWASRAPV